MYMYAVNDDEYNFFALFYSFHLTILKMLKYLVGIVEGISIGFKIRELP